MVVSPEENSDTLWINQDARLSLGNFKKDFATSYEVHNNGNGIYVFVIEGEVSIDDQVLSRRDGVGIGQSEKIKIKANSDAEILVIEVPM